MKKASRIKTIVDTIPFIAILLYVLAIVYELAFFSSFDIGVLSYITLTETLLIIIEPLIFVTLYFFMIPVGLILLNSPHIPTLPYPQRIIELFYKIKKCPVLDLIAAILIAILYVLYLLVFKVTTSLSKLAQKVVEMISFFRDSNFRYLSIFFFSFLFYLSSFCIWQIFPDRTILNGMLNALAGLLWPLNIILTILIAWLLSPTSRIIVKLLNQFTLREEFFFLFLYYVYALAVFCYSGFDYGNELKKKDTTVFKIQMTDGTVFDNTSHGYINKMGNYTFLYEKQSSAKIILYNENIRYLKINNNDSRNPLLYYILKKDEGKIKQERKNKNIMREKKHAIKEQHKKDEVIEAIKQSQKKVTIQQKQEIQ